MSVKDRAKWNSIYKNRVGDVFPRPDLLLLDYTPPIPLEAERRALDLAGGMGQNGLWLAEQGYIVDILDISHTALDRAHTEMTHRKIRTVNLLCVDLDEATLSPDTYDLVCVFRYLNRRLLVNLLTAIKPGGRLIYETFNQTVLEARPDFNPMFCLGAGELTASFPKWRVLRDANAGPWTQFVAIKP
jgi:SAM-dependent methyltransferase